ncbi:integrase [Cupriavidus sp. USMAA2-4]|uniref:tyrosine-type recombinase/integrase n=1 Tax=Cupriavidus sp. USMAA2-4 TaxID=876364 RepID=UPI0008A6A35D|nr:site-specific integrase [Cupriavidus sp. USMAA2-4]AOY94321.1 integrase [Cupriavidus sp. USMAA2-4]AOY96905.1 integrase [Cupriavidus sp. USMAA2-4]
MPIETITKNGRRRYRWTFERTIEGKRIRKTKIIPAGVSAAEADKLGRQWDAEVYALETGVKKRTVTIGECVQLHFTDKGASWKDLSSRSQIMEKYAPEYEGQDAMDLYDWSIRFTSYLRSNVDHNGTRKKPLADKSISNVLGYVRAAIKYAYKKGLIEHDETGRMVIPNFDNERHIYEDRRTMLEIARACSHREVRAAIRVAFYSGMRLSEILRAAVTRDGYSLVRTKNGRPRIVPIHRRIAVIARSVRFTIKPQKVKDEWVKARTKAGYPDLRFHDLRHSAASEMINGGVDLYTVGGVLGHKTPASTKRYAHLLTDRLADAVSKIGKSK